MKFVLMTHDPSSLPEEEVVGSSGAGWWPGVLMSCSGGPHPSCPMLDVSSQWQKAMCCVEMRSGKWFFSARGLHHPLHVIQFDHVAETVSEPLVTPRLGELGCGSTGQMKEPRHLMM